MVYVRRAGDEKYVIAVNPSGKSVKATITSQGSKETTYVLGTTKKAGYKSTKINDIIELPAVSAAIFKIE